MWVGCAYITGGSKAWFFGVLKGGYSKSVEYLGRRLTGSDVFGANFREDVKAIAELHTVLFPVKYSEGFYESLFEDNTVVILAYTAAQNMLVGLSTARIEEDSGSCYARCDGYIATLGVKPGHRRGGLGGFLLQRTIDLLRDERNCLTIKLHVKADNIAAINMYYKCGFELLEHLVNHYYFDGKRHDALHLVKYLNHRRKQSSLSTGWSSNCTIL
ncbi:hypothetical protein AAMO2058_001675100 [Amorphochlora amoebiformis]